MIKSCVIIKNCHCSHHNNINTTTINRYKIGYILPTAMSNSEIQYVIIQTADQGIFKHNISGCLATIKLTTKNGSVLRVSAFILLRSLNSLQFIHLCLGLCSFLFTIFYKYSQNSEHLPVTGMRASTMKLTSCWTHTGYHFMLAVGELLPTSAHE